MFDFSGRPLDLSYPHVMGIMNVTPDSFSDGGELLQGNDSKVSLDKVLIRAELMVAAGAEIIDVGGESTRPGAALVSSQEEIDRVIPAIEALSSNFDVIVSVDTSNPTLIALCPEYGVGLINDVRALSTEGALGAAAKSGIPVCLMHMQGQPEDMQNAPVYIGLVEEITTFLNERITACLDAGIDRRQIIIDPGFGFGKSLKHNVELLSKLEQLQNLDMPLLIGLSRKRMLGAITGRAEKDRMAAGLASAVLAAMQGASIIRTHDVAETVDAMKVCIEILKTQNNA